MAVFNQDDEVCSRSRVVTKKFILEDGTELTQEQYLYGIDSDVEPIPAHIICRRVELLNDMIDMIHDEDLKERDSYRLNACINARTFWLKLGE